MENREASFHDPSWFLHVDDLADLTGQVLPSDRIGTLIVLNQPIHARRAFSQCHRRCRWHVYADGGANRVRDGFGGPIEEFEPEIIIGDLDSLDEDVETSYRFTGALIVHDPDQYSTDFSKAVKASRQLQGYHSVEAFQEASSELQEINQMSGRRLLWTEMLGMHVACECDSDEKSNVIVEGQQHIDMIIFGGLGGRLDQGIGVLSELGAYQASVLSLAKSSGSPTPHLWLFSEKNLSWILEGPEPGTTAESCKHILRLCARESSSDTKYTQQPFTSNVGILPVFGPALITTKGLEWDVHDWETQIGGQVSTSNHVVDDNGLVEITTTARVLFTVELSYRMLDMDCFR